MNTYRRSEDYQSRLRKVVLHSGDVIPEDVASYVLEAVRHGHWQAQQDILKEYAPLVDWIPTTLVDACLEMLIRPDEQLREHDFHDWRDLGIRHDWEFLPSAHIQGPFLYALRRNPEQGLRLVHQLTNVAADRWCERERNPRFLDYVNTPLPVSLEVGNRLCEFWGTQDVYYWFRPNSNGPNAVVSALMALELWMEEEIERGNPADELFAQVLSPSICVAVPGVCLGIALAYPEKCLRAALPIMSCPAIWLFDIARVAADRTPSYNFAFLGGDSPMYEARAERDRRPQRIRDIRTLAMSYELTAPAELREAFENAVSQFTANIPFFYQEEIGNDQITQARRERIEEFQVYADRRNFQQRRTSTGIEVWAEMPERITARNEAVLSSIAQEQQWASVSLWAQASMEDGKPAAGLTLADATAAAKSFQRHHDFQTTVGARPDPPSWRLQAIAGVAAAALVLDYDWCLENGLLIWCRDTLMLAARMPQDDNDLLNRHSIFPLDPRISAARGLSKLVERGGADDQVRGQVVCLVADQQLQVVGTVFSSLRAAWSRDEVLCWNALVLGISLSFLPTVFSNSWNDPVLREEENSWRERLLRESVASLADTGLRDLPRLQLEENSFIWDLASRCLHALPLEEICRNDEARAVLLRLTDDLLAWTVRENRPHDRGPGDYHQPPWEWNGFFMNWVAFLGRQISTEEVRTHIFEPLQATWSVAPRLTGDLLQGYIAHHIGYMDEPPSESRAQWTDLCEWVLNTREVTEGVSRRYFDRDVVDVLRMITYVQFGTSLLKDEWPHARHFERVLDKWVVTVGHHPEAYPALIIMLDGPGFVFAPEPALRWLEIITAVGDTSQIWDGGAGDKTARFLMKVWNRFEAEIRRDRNELRRYSQLIDGLAAAGVALASVLQQTLERK